MLGGMLRSVAGWKADKYQVREGKRRDSTRCFSVFPCRRRVRMHSQVSNTRDADACPPSSPTPPSLSFRSIGFFFFFRCEQFDVQILNSYNLLPGTKSLQVVWKRGSKQTATKVSVSAALTDEDMSERGHARLALSRVSNTTDPEKGWRPGRGPIAHRFFFFTSPLLLLFLAPAPPLNLPGLQLTKKRKN